MPKGGKYRAARTITSNGYVLVTVFDGDGKGRRVLEHVAVAERALGRRLPAAAKVHHVDGDRTNNTPSNLVICPDQKYHSLLHIRADALEASGNATYRRCGFCREYDDPSRLVVGRTAGDVFYHRDCYNEAQREGYRARKEKEACRLKH